MRQTIVAVMSLPPILQTPRLVLRALRAADAAPMAILANDFDIARMTTSIPHPFTLSHAEDFIARMEAGDPARDLVFAIDHRREGLIGVVGFHHREGPAPEIGYWLGRPFWGQGHMSEAVAASMGWVRADWRKRMVISGHFADNPASGQILIKAGFLYTGEVIGRFSVARGEETPTRMMVWLG
jgi:RimJ/RimL family protein N-acetyltransferase